MEFKNLFEKFNNDGKLLLPNNSIHFSDIPWSKHATFDGVELKHLITAKQSGGQFSYHLVRIAPNMKIGNHTHMEQLETHEVIAGSGICINDNTELNYEAGVISILPKAIPHEVKAGMEGLYLFAKFIPALL
ncbi:cupin [Anaerosporobacter sp.]|uniref:cupin n=1 Tax=Anaerosporobacter sp. TaxID=1872529 RepID=UPI00286F0D59|nr:cupin [Anaerosporobacter sp.]